MLLTLDDRCPVMPWDDLDSVIFDVGNVLLAFQPEALIREILPEHEALHAELLDRMFRTPYWPMLDRGVASPEEATEAMASGRPDLRPLLEKFMGEWNSHMQVVDEGVDALHACKAHGKRCYVLSNYAAEPFDDACRRHPDIFSLFDGIVVSARLHLNKPDLCIYRHIIDTYRLDPARTLFIDDSAANIEGAMACGLQGLCFDRPGKLHSFIR